MHTAPWMQARDGSPGSILSRGHGDADAGATMRSHPRSVVLAAALIAPAAAFTASCGDSDNPATRAAAPAPAVSASATTVTRPALATALRHVVAAGSPGVIALVNDGRKVRLSAAGVADTSSGRTLRPTDRFRAGSITKSFVSTVALQLVGEGKLSLSDSVEHWLPGILPYGDDVTVRQLLNLTSGVPDNQGPVEAEFLKGNMTRSWSPRELVALVADKKPDFAPGTSWAYSNTNYMLAGLIIERVTGNQLGHELKQRIFKPLHLRGTSFPQNTSTIAGSHSDGHAYVDGKLLDVTVLNPSGTWAAGNLVSTATDVAHFWRALLGGKLLAPRQLAAMKKTVPLQKGVDLGYGLAIFKWPTACGPVWGNGGDIAGYNNRFQNSEDGKRQAGVIVPMNPMPKGLGEPVGGLKQAAISDALGSRKLC
jgi:D-alanyl-D-alanine carboxypeptidase